MGGGTLSRDLGAVAVFVKIGALDDELRRRIRVRRRPEVRGVKVSAEVESEESLLSWPADQDYYFRFAKSFRDIGGRVRRFYRTFTVYLGSCAKKHGMFGCTVSKNIASFIQGLGRGEIVLT